MKITKKFSEERIMFVDYTKIIIKSGNGGDRSN